jgi:hypothetical protein
MNWAPKQNYGTPPWTGWRAFLAVVTFFAGQFALFWLLHQL